MQELPVDQAGPSGVRRQQPHHKGDLQLIIQRKPTERKRPRQWGQNTNNILTFNRALKTIKECHISSLNKTLQD
uniref:Uncharacterized protein n=1 Tax=Anguilla anguilla TaxID=7936 RepID=A0A0E9W6Q0_ANGAN